MRLLLALLLLPAAAWSQEPAPPNGARCDRTIPRARAAIPQFNDGSWKLVDSGRFTFDYRFYAKPGETRDGKVVVTAMAVAGAREDVFVTDKLSWQVGSEIYSVRMGPEGEGEDVCVRAVRGDLDLERLYRTLQPRLQRPAP